MFLGTQGASEFLVGFVGRGTIVASSITGIGSSNSGLDVGSTVDQLLYVERAPERLMQTQQSAISAKVNALQGLKSKLDSLEDTANLLKDFTGPLTSRVATSSNTSIFSATATQAAVSGTHTIVVNGLATISSAYTTAVSANTKFMPGDLVFAIGGGSPVTVTLDSAHTTLASAAEYINTKSLGVNAQVISDTTGSRLALVSSVSGAAGKIQVTASPVGLDFHSGTQGIDAQLVVDGIPVSSASNTVSGIVLGVTLDLSSALPDAQVKLTVAADTGRAKQAIGDFVNAFNTVIKGTNEQFSYNASSRSSGILAGDQSLRNVQNELLSMFSFKNSGNSIYQTLNSVGIQMGNDGTLTIKDDVLDGALSANPKEVVQLFQGTAADGFANKVSKCLSNLTDTTDGVVSASIKGLNDTNNALQKSIDNFELRMEIRKQALTAEYDRINTLLQQFTLTQQQLTAQLGTTNK
jgi:flagellar hook-associated protein 2